VGWITLPRNLLETQLDSLGIEKARRFETGITDPDSVTNTERLNDYPDYEEDSRCSASGELVTTEDRVLRQTACNLVVACHQCGKTVYALWRRSTEVWFKGTHYGTPLVSEVTDVSATSETNSTSG